MLCLIVQPNGFLLEITLPPNARGQECLDKVCEKLNIIEIDFFGLQYTNKNGDFYWLNLRNPIRQQSIRTKLARFYLRVKFYVPPYLIQQDSTRHQFYLNIRNALKERHLKVPSCIQRAKLISFIAQAEVGDYCDNSFDLKQLYLDWILAFGSDTRSNNQTNSNDLPDHNPEFHEVIPKNDFSKQSINEENSPTLIIESKFQKTIERLSNEHSAFYQSIVLFHRQLSGYLLSKTENCFLDEVSQLEDIGISYFNVRIGDQQREKCKIGVGIFGVTIKHREKKLINYSSLVKVRTLTNFFTLKYYDEESGEAKEKKFRLSSSKNANAIYREITEKHVFYSCSTVGDSVATQCFLGLSGMFWSFAPSIFKEHSEMGKNFVFDIRRTLRQFYDDVQRTMFKLNARLENRLTLEQTNDAVDRVGTPESEASSIQQPSSSDIEKHYCRICFDNQISCAFVPCGHVMSCENCGKNFETCPVCRTTIDDKLKIFF